MSKKKKRYGGNDGGGFVYSTDPNFEPHTGDEEKEETPPPSQQDLRVRLDRLKGNKKVTVVDGFVGRHHELAQLGRDLKSACGCGGSVKDGLILIQGDQRDQVGDYLKGEGYRFKFSGG